MMKRVLLIMVSLMFVSSMSYGFNVLIDYGAEWAGGQTGNQATIDFFDNYFQNTTVAWGDYSNVGADASLQATVSAADVLVLCRSTYSGGYGPDDQAFYNTLTIPVIDLTSYTARSSKLGWEGGETGSGPMYGSPEITVTAAGASVFGVSEGDYDWFIASSQGWNLNAGSGSVGDGDILASITNDAGDAELNAVVGWNTGDMIASGEVQSGNRLLFNLPLDGNQIPGNQEGLDAMIAAVAAYTDLEAIPEPATMMLLGLGGLLIRRKR